jgi:hypothetical protein
LLHRDSLWREIKKGNNLEVIEVVRFSDIALVGAAVPSNIWQKEYERLEQRKQNPTDSYTSRLLKTKMRLSKNWNRIRRICAGACYRKSNFREALDVIYAQCLAWPIMDKLERNRTKS